MTRRVPRRRDGADRPLAAAFRRNAAGFHRAAQAALEQHPEITRYYLAIAIELALKAYLLQRGVTDDWNRVYLRHDLSRALRCARRAGFSRAPPALADLAALLGPYYAGHAIAHMPEAAIASVCWPQACRTARDLIDAVADEADRAAPVYEGVN